MKHLERSAAPVPVRVASQVAEAAEAGLQQLVLVSPGGWRVDGLSEKSTAHLLGRLAC